MESVVSVLLQQKFFMDKFRRDDDVSAYISKLEDVQDKWKQAICYKLLKIKVLGSLLDRYRHFIPTTESIAEMTSKILTEEKKLNFTTVEEEIIALVWVLIENKQ